ncbi:ATP-binding protein [Nocardiopsis alba]|uniref:ATP-binding protein n=1 Tax=Nocardiopsis alba TaxID=53437 RepID=UPI00366B81F4
MQVKEAAPEPAGLVASLAAFGYTVEASVADLVDNSISAHATQVDVDLIWEGADSWISVSDNGYGMSEDELVTAMTVAARWGAKRGKTDLGRFGMGLKSASFAHARLLTVASRRVAEDWHIRTWDLDLISEKGKWLLIEGATAEAKGPLMQALEMIDGPGTVVLWQRLPAYQGATEQDSRVKHQFLLESGNVTNHLGLTFHRFLNGPRAVRLRVNSSPVQPWDPFLQDHLSTVRMPTEELLLDGHLVKITPFVLPAPHRLTDEERQAAGRDQGWLKLQGLYIYRRDRLIAAGGWYRLRKREEKFNQARIALEVPAETDEHWNVDVKKSTAWPPVSLRRPLRSITDRACREAAISMRTRGRVAAMRNDSRLEFAWKLDKRSDGTITCRINRKHSMIQALLSGAEELQVTQINALLRLLEEALPIPGLRVLHETDAADDPEPFDGGSPDSDMEQVARNMVDVFVHKGISEREALLMISRMPPFDELKGFWNQDHDKDRGRA